MPFDDKWPSILSSPPDPYWSLSLNLASAASGFTTDSHQAIFSYGPKEWLQCNASEVHHQLSSPAASLMQMLVAIMYRHIVTSVFCCIVSAWLFRWYALLVDIRCICQRGSYHSGPIISDTIVRQSHTTGEPVQPNYMVEHDQGVYAC